MFKDIHCHLLPVIDDGSKSMDESVRIIKKAVKEGVTDIMLTPHYIDGTDYNCDNKSKMLLLDQLKESCALNDVNINLYLGNEVLITDKFVDLMINKRIYTLNNSRYLLFSLPMNTTYPNVKKVVGELIKMGCVPILSHPERYKEYQKHPEKLVELTEMGVLLQGNYKSLLGKNGTVACKTIKTLLKKGLITFLGSDTHHLESYDIKSARKAVKKIVLSDDIVEDLFCNNFDKVINDLDIN